MKTLNRYISKTISQTFFPIFFSLFAITSVIYLVKIASLTSIITISFLELIYMYSLTLPEILFFTLPITFFIAMIINFSKLSNDYELIVLTSFGQSPLKLIKLILPLASLFSIALFLISFILMPQAKFLNKSFLNEKQQEAQFNIKPSEYGQSFGPWFIYVKDKTKNTYLDITLLQPKENEDIFIQAKSATITNNQDFLSLELFNGNAHSIKQDIKQIDFNKMVINNQLKEIKHLNSIDDIIAYWKTIEKNHRLKRHFIQNILVSLLPLISVLFYLAYGYFNPRYDKNRATLYGIGYAVLYVVIMQQIVKSENINLIVTLPIFWILLSLFLYSKRVRPYY